MLRVVLRDAQQAHQVLRVARRYAEVGAAEIGQRRAVDRHDLAVQDRVTEPNDAVHPRGDEPAGEAHTLVITEDSPEAMIAFFVVAGGLIYLDRPNSGTFAAYEDGFTLLELTRKHYCEAGLDQRKLDLLVR